MIFGLDIAQGELAALIIFSVQTVVLLLAFYNPKACCKLICSHSWGLLTTIYDEATDIGVLVSWYYLATTQKRNDIDTIDMLAWFLMLLGVILLCRIINTVYILRKITFLQPVFGIFFGFLNFAIASVICYDWKKGGCCQCLNFIYQETSKTAQEAERQISIDIINARRATDISGIESESGTPGPPSPSVPDLMDGSTAGSTGSISSTMTVEDAANAIINTKLKMVSKLLFNEAVWEGIPAIILQSVFLIRTYDINNDIIDSNDTRLVLFSLLGSYLVVSHKYATAMHGYRTDKQIVDQDNINMGKVWHIKIFFLVSILVRVSIYVLLWSVLGVLFFMGFIGICIVFYVIFRVLNCCNHCVKDDNKNKDGDNDEHKDEANLHFMTKVITDYVYYDLFGCAAKFNFKDAETEIDYDTFEKKKSSMPLFYCQWGENFLAALFAVILDQLSVVDCQSSILFECVDSSVRKAGANVVFTVYFSITFFLLVVQMVLFCLV